MPADLVLVDFAKDADSVVLPREKTLRHEVWQHRTSANALFIEKKATWETIEKTFAEFVKATDKYAGFWERRARQCEAALRRALATMPTSGTDNARTDVVEVLLGNKLCDAGLLSKAEGAMIGAYRQMDPSARQMVRTLMDRLASAPSQSPAKGGA